MKKVFAAFAASAVAVSMLAFAGCGDTTADDGAIKGNYTEKTPEQITEIVDKIDTDKIFDSNKTTMAIKVDLAGGYNMADMMSADGSIKFDYKLNASETGFAGMGSVELNGKITNATAGGKQEDSISFNGTAYNNTEWIYAAAGEDKAKINLQELMGAFEEDKTPEITPNPMAFLTADEEESFNIMTILAMAQQFDVKVTIDDKDGYKFKLSACEETVWKGLLAFGADAGITEEAVAAMKESITFNTFKFDVYFALDAQGAFSAASVVMDIDFNMPVPTTEPEAYAADAAVPTIAVKVKGSIAVSLSNETVTVPDSVTGDTAYVDMTDTVVGMIKGAM